jgi:hypothetical protein
VVTATRGSSPPAISSRNLSLPCSFWSPMAPAKTPIFARRLRCTSGLLRLFSRSCCHPRRMPPVAGAAMVAACTSAGVPTGAHFGWGGHGGGMRFGGRHFFGGGAMHFGHGFGGMHFGHGFVGGMHFGHSPRASGGRHFFHGNTHFGSRSSTFRSFSRRGFGGHQPFAFTSPTGR